MSCQRLVINTVWSIATHLGLKCAPAEVLVPPVAPAEVCSGPSSMGGKDSLVPVEVDPTVSAVVVLVFLGRAGL